MDKDASPIVVAVVPVSKRNLAQITLREPDPTDKRTKYNYAKDKEELPTGDDRTKMLVAARQTMNRTRNKFIAEGLDE